MQRSFGRVDNDHSPKEGYPTPAHYYHENQLAQPEINKRKIAEIQQQIGTRSVELTVETPYRYSGEISPADLISQMAVPYQVELEARREEEMIKSFEGFGNPELPTAAYKQEIIEAVASHQVTIISGDTGSGKSTQVPQFLYEAGHSIAMTQPRRIAAYGVAERIDEELRQVSADELPENVVGYHTAEKNTTDKSTKITVFTDGLKLVKKLNEKSSKMEEILVIDEVHEWNENIELLVAHTKKLLAENSDMKLVIMSATMDGHDLARYYGEVTKEAPSVIEVPGRTFGVEKSELPTETVESRILHHAERLSTKKQSQIDALERGEEFESEPTDILVFLPGLGEINDKLGYVKKHLPAEMRDTVKALPLHSKVGEDIQQEVFQAHHEGIKIILATNVAQTSITVNGIDTVIDSGLERRIELDEAGVQGLRVAPASRADLTQRMGRTGRTAPGHYELVKLDESTDFVPFIERPQYSVPEILRVDLARSMLRLIPAGLDIETLDFYHPIEKESIKRAKDELYGLGAIDQDGNITKSGRRMNDFPLSPNSGRMMVESENYSKPVRSYMAAMTAIKEVGGLPMYNKRSSNWKKLTSQTKSDMLAQLDIFIAMNGQDFETQREFDIDVKNMRRAHEQFNKINNLVDGSDDALATNPSSDQIENMQSCIYAGMVNQVFKFSGNNERKRPSFRHLNSKDKTRREISNRSVVDFKGRKDGYLVGEKWRAEFKRGSELVDRHIIEGVTVLEDPKVLGKIAARLVSWEQTSQETHWRNGRPAKNEKLMLGEIEMSDSREAEAAPSETTRQVIIDKALDRPGPAQEHIRRVKSEVEKLQHRTTQDLKKITHSDLMKMVDQAAPTDIVDPFVIDNNLWIAIDKHNITVDNYVSPEKQQEIMENSPSTIDAGGVEYYVEYHGGEPRIKRYQNNDILKTDGDITLADGRKVMFVYKKQMYSSSQLKSTLQA